MLLAMNRRASVDEFLKQKRIAFVGVSRNERHFSRSLFREFVKRGYEVIPVNPNAETIDGKPSFASVTQIEPPVESALLITPNGQTRKVVEECAAAGVRRVWMYRAAGQGSVDRAAVEFCDARDIDVIAGECPNMFFPDAGWVHRTHGFIRRLTGNYPG
ncbi:MAG: CoA-binding protein [Bryobacterales bacterium]|nr:CoA-binding protein [Bryobacterales bacterium]